MDHATETDAVSATEPQLHINHLPNLAVQGIFKHVPLKYQINNLDVCQYWRQVQLKEFQGRKTLTLLINADTTESIERSPFRINLCDHLTSLQPPLHSPKLADILFNSIDVSLLDSESIQFLQYIFPQLSNLQIVNNYPNPADDSFDRQMSILFDTPWDTSLVSLEIISAENSSVDADKLLEAISKLENLKHLTLDFYLKISHNAFQLNPELFQMKDLAPILSRVETFKLQTHDMALFIIPPLLEFGVSSESIKHIEIGSLIGDREYALLMNAPNEFAQKFRYLHFEYLSDEMLSHVVQKFSCLTRLKMTLNEWNLAAVIALSKLAMLFELKIIVNEVDMLCPTFNYLIPQLTAVKVLQVKYRAKTHSDLEMYRLNYIFPNLQILHIKYYNKKCTKCCYKLPGEILLDKYGEVIRGRIPFTIDCIRALVRSVRKELWTDLRYGLVTTDFPSNTNCKRWTFDEL